MRVSTLEREQVAVTSNKVPADSVPEHREHADVIEVSSKVRPTRSVTTVESPTTVVGQSYAGVAGSNTDTWHDQHQLKEGTHRSGRHTVQINREVSWEMPKNPG